ncbi:MAG: response regulator [Nitrospirota bacterium]
MNIVCAKCGAGVAFELPSLVNHTVIQCAACHSGLKVTIEAFEVSVTPPSQQAAATPTTPQRVMVAVQGEATRELIRDLLVAAGFDVVELNSGSEALAKVSDVRPALVLVDVGLSDMPGFQVCESVRGDAVNAGVKMILVAAIHNKDRYRRPPDNLFGADDYIERHQIESQLVDKVKQLCGDGTPAGGATGDLSPAIEPAPTRSGTPSLEQVTPPASPPKGEPPVTAAVIPEPPPPVARESAPPAPSSVRPAPAPSAPPPVEKRTPVAAPAGKEAATAASPTPPSPAPNPAQEAALRLARIIVSDIALYNAKKVDEGILNGTFFDLLRAEIEEGRKLYEERKGPDLATTVDLFQQTLEQFVSTRRELLKRNRPAAA